MNDYIWLAIVVVIAAIAITFIFLYYRANILLVQPSQCSSSTGTYGVRPGNSGTVTKTIQNVTLAQAISDCDADPGCTTFSYSSTGQFMNIIDTTQPIVSAPTLDLYQSRITK
jgi:hypothetical protein